MEEVSPKSRLTATLLAVFLGVFGAHRIYLEKMPSAVVMLILGISGSSILGIMLSVRFDAVAPRVLVPPPFGIGVVGTGIVAAIIVFAVAGVWAFVDFIFIVSGKMKDRDGKPVKKWSASAE
jgi:TM2 domain-containing membrane protein YozV